jgi:streptogramin lyase
MTFLDWSASRDYDAIYCETSFRVRRYFPNLSGCRARTDDQLLPIERRATGDCRWAGRKSLVHLELRNRFTRPGGISAIDMKGVVVFAYDTPSAQPFNLITGPGDSLWFSYSDGIGRLTATGTITLFPLQKVSGRIPGVLDLAAGSDGNVWFIEWPLNQVGRITPNGQISEFPTQPPVCCGPVRIVAGSDGGLWLAFNGGDKIARISTAGTITEIHDVPYVRDSANYAGATVLAAGPDGRIWFGTHERLVCSVSSTGSSALPLSPVANLITSLTAGPDGNVWATLAPPVLICAPPDCGWSPDLMPPLAIARVNLVNPAPAINAVERGFDQATGTPTLKISGLGFVPDTVIRLNGMDRSTIYVSPFELGLQPADASLAAYGGTLVAHNIAPGGGDSTPFALAPVSPLRRHAARP